MGTNKHNTLQVAHSTSYTLQLLEDTGFLACKPASIPMDHNINLTSVKDSPLADASKYRRLIGQLLYLTTTRPDITFAVHKLSQFIAEPHQVHLNAAHQVLHYLKNSPGQSLFYSAASKHTHKAFSDVIGHLAYSLEDPPLGSVFFLETHLYIMKIQEVKHYLKDIH